MASNVPSHHRALVLESKETDLQVKTIPTPQPELGSAIIHIEAAGTSSYLRNIYNGTREFSIFWVPMPLVGGFTGIGRVAALGADATTLQLGQLVYVDCVIRGRDNPNVIFLSAINGGRTDASKKLMQDVWRDGPMAEYVRTPLENCIPLNETKLCKELGYSANELMYMCYLLVGYGGLRDINLEPGETIVISPATGGFAGAAVKVAIAMGARVIAMGRNENQLAYLKEHVAKTSPKARVETVKISGDEQADTAALQAHGPIDAVLDISPIAAAKSTHLKSAINSLRRGGRCSVMGFCMDMFSHGQVVSNNITLKGKLMYERDDMLQLVKMLEAGLFPHGKDLVDSKAFKLDDWKEALDVAAEHTGIGKYVVVNP